jgi:hypothetical protein
MNADLWCLVLVDPPAPGEDDWPSFEVTKPIAKIGPNQSDHVRDAELFRRALRRSALSTGMREEEPGGDGCCSYT